MTDVEFFEALQRLGFELAQDRRSGEARIYSARTNEFLTYWVHVFDDGTALFTWEFAVADYLLRRGIQLGSGETLNLFMFPSEDERGPHDSAWLVEAMNRVDARLAAVDFANPVD